MNLNQMSIAEFRQYMLSFDWFTHMSDDHQVWQRGEAALKELSDFMSSPRAKEVHRGIYNWSHSTQFNTEHFCKEGEYMPPYPQSIGIMPWRKKPTNILKLSGDLKVIEFDRTTGESKVDEEQTLE